MLMIELRWWVQSVHYTIPATFCTSEILYSKALGENISDKGHHAQTVIQRGPERLHPGGRRGKDTCSVTGPNLKPTRATAMSIPGRGHRSIPAEQIIATGEFSVEFSRLTPNYTIKNISSKDLQQKHFASPYQGHFSPLFFFFFDYVLIIEYRGKA